VESCEQCTSLVGDLGELRLALAQLPDLPPSRPLQLVPPVAEGAAAGGGWLRRMAAPVMAAGAAMAVIGAVGFGAVALGGMAASGAAIFQNVGDNLETTDRGDNEAPRPAGERSLDNFGEEVADPQEGFEPPAERDRLASLDIDFNGPGPWLVLAGAGVILLLLGLSLRHSRNPRAG
jgi:hypothetical protein